MKVAAVIPARMQSLRLPGKPLRLIGGVPMILRVLARARACPELDRIIVATDSEEIHSAVVAGGGEARMTSPQHRTGSDRVAEVAQNLSEDLVLNLQGDEPFLPASTVTELVRFGRARPELTVATAMIPIEHERDIVNPNIVKVVGSLDRKALYFSRLPVPYLKRSPLDSGLASQSARTCSGYYKHIGIYLYSRQFLLQFVAMQPTPLEISESLEQLRILEHGFPVFLVPVTEDSLSVDTEDDLTLAEAHAAEERETSGNLEP